MQDEKYPLKVGIFDFILQAQRAVLAVHDCRRGRVGKCRAEIHHALRRWPGRSQAIPNQRRLGRYCTVDRLIDRHSFAMNV